MESLPLELYGAIFDHLHLTDLGRLRRVSKKFRFLVQDYRIEELLCFIPESDNYNQREYQNSFIIKRKNERNFVEHVITRYPYLYPHLKEPQKFYTAPIFLKSGQFNAQFLKSFSYVFLDEDYTVKFTDINKLVQLERLEVSFCSPPSKGDDKLCLPKLRTFLLLRTIQDFDLEVDAPRLEGFHFENHPNDHVEANRLNGQLIRLKFKHPESVKYLSLYRYHKKSHVFRNIEYLQISSTSLIMNVIHICSPGLIDEELFVAFPRLKTLKIMNHGSLEGLKRLFRRKNLGGRNCEMFFHGIRLVDGKELEVFEEKDLEEKGFHNYMDCYFPTLPHFSTPAHFSAQLHNYDKLEEGLNFVTKIEHLTVRDLEMVGKFFEADSHRFLRIFDSVTTVSSGIRIKRPELFVRFLTSLSLVKLIILNSGMPQEYFDRLSIKTLKRLEVEEEKKIDLSFTNNIPELLSLETNHVVTIEKEVKLKGRNNLCIQAKIGKWFIIIWRKHYDPTDGMYCIGKWLITDTTDRHRAEEKSYEVAVRWFEEELEKEERVFLNEKNEALGKA